jgi:hypothetical protein
MTRVEALRQTDLAVTLNGNRPEGDARTIAAPVCRLDTAESRPTPLPLKSVGICD